MSPKHLPPSNSSRAGAPAVAFFAEELPLTVREAAVYMGVSVQTVYLWVERNQIPHLRVMGRNIRFLKSDLAPFRAQFRRVVAMSRPRNYDGRLFRKEESKFWWIDYRDRDGKRQRESTNSEDWEETQKRLRGRLQARDSSGLGKPG
jgi:excisionase family DNA binding protein